MRNLVACSDLSGIFMLGIDDGQADLDRREFVGADAAGENFLFPQSRIEVPALA